jgi:hypothetical protein
MYDHLISPLGSFVQYTLIYIPDMTATTKLNVLRAKYPFFFLLGCNIQEPLLSVCPVRMMP